MTGEGSACDKTSAGPTSGLRRRRIGYAELVSDQLRRRILSGELADGDLLPKQEDLVVEYGVSKAALRDALRILDAEGLVSVRRGNVGGAVVHIPEPENAAYTLGLVLQARQVRASDVQAALGHFEPVCAGLCAGRRDRKRTVLPLLRAAQTKLRKATHSNDDAGVLAGSRDFHEALVAGCGSETLIILVGTLEAIWTSHSQAFGRSANAAGYNHEPSLRAQVVADHDEIIHSISAGDVDSSATLARTHWQRARLHSHDARLDLSIEATAIRDAGTHYAFLNDRSPR